MEWWQSREYGQYSTTLASYVVRNLYFTCVVMVLKESSMVYSYRYDKRATYTGIRPTVIVCHTCDVCLLCMGVVAVERTANYRQCQSSLTRQQHRYAVECLPRHRRWQLGQRPGVDSCRRTCQGAGGKGDDCCVQLGVHAMWFIRDRIMRRPVIAILRRLTVTARHSPCAIDLLTYWL